MPEYAIEQYEIWTQTYRVIAENPIAAVLQVLSGEAAAADNTLEFIQPDDSRGMPIDELGDRREVEAAFARADCGPLLTDGEIVDSIRRVEEVSSPSPAETSA